MSTPFHEIPDPASTVAGRNNRGILTDLTKKIALWRPKGAREPGISTIARFAHRVMGSDGNAYLADELGSGTTASILDKLKGVKDDPVRIGNEYMPEIIPVDYLQLSENQAALPTGSIALNDGELAVHDGVRDGGKNVLLSDGRVRFSYRKAASTTASLGVVLAAFKLPANYAIDGTQLKIEGRICVKLDGVDVGDGGIFITVVAADAFDAAPAAVPSAFSLALLDNSDGLWNYNFMDANVSLDLVLDTAGAPVGEFVLLYDTSVYDPPFAGICIADDIDTDPGVLRNAIIPVNNTPGSGGDIGVETEIYVIAEWASAGVSPISPLSIVGELEMTIQ
jgi:hypothetical protein